VLGHHGDQIEVRDFYFCSFFCFFFLVVIWNLVLDSSLLVLLLPASHRLVLGDFCGFVSVDSFFFFFPSILLLCQVCWLVKGKVKMTNSELV
jgi:hypothetical protein